MSQRRALFASIIITLVLALSAIGIRAAMTDTPAEDAAAKSSLPVLVTGNGTTQGDDTSSDDTSYDDDSNEHEGDDEDHEDESYANSRSDDDSSSSKSEAWHEEDNDDD